MEPPLVSVILPCHNHAATLGWALASLVAQTHAAWECFVVDDGSDDSPENVVEAFRDPRITYLRFEKNRGPSAARQAGLVRTRGEYVALLDADDWIYPERFARQIQRFAEVPGLAAVGCGMAIVDAENRLVGLRGCDEWRGAESLRSPLPSGCGKATVMLRGRLARAVRFDPDLRQGEDVDFLSRALTGRVCHVLGSPLYAYRQETEGTAARSLRSHAIRRAQLRAASDSSTVSTRLRLLESHLKSAIYFGARALRLDRGIAAFRNERASPVQRQAFERAQEKVAARLPSVI